jgi:hypothetical protein
MSESDNPFNKNAEMARMRDDVANRKFNIKIKGMLITGALMLGGFALLAVAPALLGAATPLIGVALMGASAIAGLFTLKETKKLEVDEQYLQGYMQGKTHWGEGYRKEVAEHGYSLGGPVVTSNGPDMGGIPGARGGQYRGTNS